MHLIQQGREFLPGILADESLGGDDDSFSIQFGFSHISFFQPQGLPKPFRDRDLAVG